MKLVVDTNILISALICDSAARQLLMHLPDELITVGFSKEEIVSHKSEILEKAKIRESEFDMLMDKLTEKIVLISDPKIFPYIDTAKKVMGHIDPKDIPFIAAALAARADIWSDDKHFEKQNKIKIWKTKDLLRFI